MDILVLHTSFMLKDRKALADSLYCFRLYGKKHRFFYLDIRDPRDMVEAVFRYPFDAVILHYSLLSKRLDPEAWERLYNPLRDHLRQMPAYKVMIPQDEYNRIGALRTLAGECGVGHIFTLTSPYEYDVAYPPESTGGAGCTTVHPGYVDEDSLKLVARLAKKYKTRDIMIGYRARKLPYWVGRHGQVKTEIAERVDAALADRPEIVTDINTTGNSGENTFLGNDWYRFLLRCRTMLGCLGGASLMDVTGEISEAINRYVAQHPDADFDEVEAACFPGQDYNLHYYCLGPRHFECAMTKTCQVLVEGDYFGVFEPGVHYIEIKKDFSNLDDVLEQVQDSGLCEQIAQRCYDDVVALRGVDNPNTYAWFVNCVVGQIEANVAPSRHGVLAGSWLYLRLRCRRPWRKLLWRLSIARKKTKDSIKMTYYRLCNFSERHPALQKFLGFFRRR